MYVFSFREGCFEGKEGFVVGAEEKSQTQYGILRNGVKQKGKNVKAISEALLALALAMASSCIVTAPMGCTKDMTVEQRMALIDKLQEVAARNGATLTVVVDLEPQIGLYQSVDIGLRHGLGMKAFFTLNAARDFASMQAPPGSEP